MSDESRVSKPLHEQAKYLCSVFQAKVLILAHVTVSETRYTWAYDVERLRMYVADSWRGYRLAKRANRSSNLEEAATPSVTNE